MSLDQQINWFAAALAVETVIILLAVLLALAVMVEARWWRRRALKADPALALLDDGEPPFVGRLLDLWRAAL